VHELIEARDDKRLLRLQRQLAGHKLLIVDELGYVPLSQTGADQIDGYGATGRARDAVAGHVKDEGAVAPRAAEEPVLASNRQTEPTPTAAPSRVEAMRAKIKAGGHASPYRLRKQPPEPVFGQIKQARGFRQFLLRGFEKVRAEWAIVCTAHNLLKFPQWRSLSVALSPAR